MSMKASKLTQNQRMQIWQKYGNKEVRGKLLWSVINKWRRHNNDWDLSRAAKKKKIEMIIDKQNKKMNSKFYVSLEAARLLREKGYDKPTDYIYVIDGPFYSIWRNKDGNMESNYYPVPTKAEAIDWLESKGIVVELRYENDELQKDDSEWEYYIYQYDNEGRLDETVSSYGMGMFYDTRLEAEDAAIVKALELL